MLQYNIYILPEMRKNLLENGMSVNSFLIPTMPGDPAENVLSD